MSDEVLIAIQRDGQDLGRWDRFQLRQFIAAGSIAISDEFLDQETGKWLPLLPRYRRKWNLFDWGDEEDRQWYYIKDGFIHGPRQEIEIFALHQAGHLPRETLIAFIGIDDWVPIEALIEDESETLPETSVKDHANNAINSLLQGDKIGAGVAGFKAIGKILKAITEPIPTVVPTMAEWLCVAIDAKDAPHPSAIAEFIETSGYQISATEIIDDINGRKLAIRFRDTAEATRAKRNLSAEFLTDTFPLILSDRDPDKSVG
jgi:hypothetical protein